MSVQQARLGPLAGAAASALERFRSERALERLWAKDASLWKADAKAQKIIANAPASENNFFVVPKVVE